MARNAAAIPVLLAIGLVAATGCAAVPDSAEEAAMRERPEQAPKVHAELVRGMLAQGQYYAALAHIEELDRSGGAPEDELTLLRASTQFKLERFEAARQAYLSLLDTDFAGQAHHGLGLVAAREHLGQAVRHFNTAVRLRPTDSELRNDLGYTLLLAGRLAEARHHLATATELAPNAVKPQLNLVISYLLEGDAKTARRLAASFNFDGAQMRRLSEQAERVRLAAQARAAEFQAPPIMESHDEMESRSQQPAADIPGLYRKRL